MTATEAQPKRPDGPTIPGRHRSPIQTANYAFSFGTLVTISISGKFLHLRHERPEVNHIVHAKWPSERTATLGLPAFARTGTQNAGFPYLYTETAEQSFTGIGAASGEDSSMY